MQKIKQILTNQDDEAVARSRITQFLVEILNVDEGETEDALSVWDGLMGGNDDYAAFADMLG